MKKTFWCYQDVSANGSMDVTEKERDAGVIFTLKK